MKLWRYIQGYRKGKDAHKLEKEAMSDPFLAHALRGYDRVEGDHIRQIEQIREDVRRRPTNKFRYFRAAGIAASILLVVGFGSYFLIREMNVDDSHQVAVFHELSPEEIISPPQPVIAKQESRERKEIPETVHDSATTPPSPVAGEVEEIYIVEEFLPAISAESLIAADTSIGEPISPVESITSSEEQQVIVQPAAKEALAEVVRGVAVGRVTDRQGEPIIGASVHVEGTTNGTVTDTEGYFWLQVADSSKIRVNFIGYESLEKMFSENDLMEFAMNEDQSTLDEVVVVGRGSRKKSKSVLREPKPVDGMRKYKKYLKENLVRPTDNECSGVKGKVVLSFHVSQDGRPERITVKESICVTADEEAIRLVTEGPGWMPGEKAVILEIEF